MLFRSVSSRVDDLNARAEELRATVDRFETGVDHGDASTGDVGSGSSVRDDSDEVTEGGLDGDADWAAETRDPTGDGSAEGDETRFGWVDEASEAPANGSRTDRAFTDGNGAGDPSATGSGEVDVSRDAVSGDDRVNNGETNGSESIDRDDGKE